jgi:hypothetical protein
MIVRAFLALTLCPVLGVLTGTWLTQQVAAISSKTQLPAVSESPTTLMGMGLLHGAAAGCAIGFLYAVTLIWCARRGPHSPQRALADLVIITLGLLFVVDWVTYIGLVPNADELWMKLLAVNAGVWLFGLLLSVVAMRNAVRRPPMAEA